MEDYYEYLDSNGVTTLYKLIKDDTVALIDSYSITINGITTNLDNHVNNTDIHTPISDIESMVDIKVSGLVNSAPETLDTLKELSDALGNDPNFATTVANQIGSKASKDDVYTKEETDTLLEGKANSVHNHVVKDITDFPTIPTKTSELSNDSNFVTSTELHDYATKNDLNSKQDALSEEQLSNIDSIPDKANKSDLSTVATSGSYKDLLDKPVLPEGADLSDYYNKGETDNLLNSKANTSDLAVVAKSGNYNDLNNTPTIPTKLSQLENDMGFGSGSGGVITSISWTNITDKPNFATVATSGSYNDLSNKPTIPKVYNKTLTIQKNGTNVATFTSNSNTDVTANITVPTKVSELSNDSGFITGISWDKVTNKPTLATVATSGSYTDLSNIPTIPTKVSQLENDTGFINTLTDVVYTKSNQTINGIKTFTNGPWVTNNGTTIGFSIKNTAIGRGEVPSEIYHNTFRVYDKNTKIMGEFCVEKSNSGSTLAQINVRSDDANGKQISRSIYFNMSNDGTKTAFYPNVNNNIDLGMSHYKWAKIYSDDVVHTSGDEYISGNKTFANNVYCYNLKHPTDDSYFFVSGGTDYDKGAALYLGGISATNFTPGRFVLVARRTNAAFELVGSPNGTLTWGGKNVALDENLVHRSGNEIIEGIKTFTNVIISKNNAADLSVTPTSYHANHNYSFTDKNNVSMGHIEYCQRPTGVNDIGIFARDKNGVAHGIHINTSNEVIPLMSSSESYSLGSSSAKWAKVYSDDVVHTSGDETIAGIKTFSNRVSFPSGYWITADTDDNSLRIIRDGTGHGNNFKVIITADTGKIFAPNGFIGNLQGNADTATYATTQATTDNSTKIATTAWVRSYVDSVVGSNTVGSSVSAYWSNSSNVTATGQASSGGRYPSCYSDYITKTPTVGTIYSGAQLYSVLNTYASAQASTTGSSSSPIYVTNTTAQAIFSTPINPSGKYLCTTANTVKFRAYTAKGSSSAVGASSIVDYTITKSIFIRVE